MCLDRASIISLEPSLLFNAKKFILLILLVGLPVDLTKSKLLYISLLLNVGILNCFCK